MLQALSENLDVIHPPVAEKRSDQPQARPKAHLRESASLQLMTRLRTVLPNGAAAAAVQEFERVIYRA